MHLTTLRIRNFRKHIDTYLELGKNVNIITGNNGQGKTNVLEAIAYLSLTKSFLAAHDSIVLQTGTDVFDVSGILISDKNTEYNARVAYQHSTGEKVFSINKQKLESRAAVLGKFPIVILSPSQYAITFGAPSERRTFMDFVLSQSSRIYFEELQTFRKILKQRNALLQEAKTRRQPLNSTFESWNEQYLTACAKIFLQRNEFVEHFQSYVIQAYAEIVSATENPSLIYEPQITIPESNSLPEIEQFIYKKLQKEKQRELATGTTLVGPHHDELLFLFNGNELRKYGSQGQHKTFLVALKVAEFRYVKHLCGETPMFLLDDVFSELDEQRAQRVLDVVRKHGQTFVTCTNSNSLDTILSYNGENKKYLMENGIILRSS